MTRLAHALPESGGVYKSMVRTPEASRNPVVETNKKRRTHIAHFAECTQQCRHHVVQLIDVLLGDPIDQVDVECQRDASAFHPAKSG